MWIAIKYSYISWPKNMNLNYCVNFVKDSHKLFDNHKSSSLCSCADLFKSQPLINLTIDIQVP